MRITARTSTSACLRGLLLLGLLLGAARAQAQPADVKTIPPALRPWIPWVLDGLGDRVCPVVDGTAVCAWPGRLTLELADTGGAFSLQVRTDRATRVGLPGSTKHWPREVTVGGEPVIVLASESQPAVKLAAGTHQVEGRFSWRRLPEALPVPGAIANVVLTVNGQAVEHPRRQDDGSLWIRSAAGAGAGEDEPERLELEVFRRIDDGVPVMVTTQLDLRISGRARELDLGAVLLEGSTPLSIESELPARLEQGQLLVQARAGKFTVTVKGRQATPPAVLKLAQRPAPWPEREIWVWSPNEQLRQVTVGGGSPIDPSRTNLPSEWRQLAAFSLSRPGSLTFETTRRGEPEVPPNRLALRRKIWLDHDGRGFTIRDKLLGQMTKDWRVNLARGQLGHVAVRDVDQLITVDTGAQQPGVEVRKGKLYLWAESRLDGPTTTLPAVGWSEDVQALSAELVLPPGYELLGASGVDEMSRSWLSSWDLFDLFLVLLIALATARLGRPLWGVLALVALVLSHGAVDAPVMLWLVLLGFIALLQVVPAGKVRVVVRAAWWVTAISLVAVLVDFSAAEVTAALYPQTRLEHTLHQGRFDQADQVDSFGAVRSGWGDEPADIEFREGHDQYKYDRDFGMIGLLRSGAGGDADAPTGPWGADDSLGTDPLSARGNMWGDKIDGKLGGKGMPKARALEQDPKAIIQTGPGVPKWEWQRWKLKWNGPVDKDHQIRLFILTPWQQSVLSLLRVGLLGLLAFLLLRSSLRGAAPPARPQPAAAGGDSGDQPARPEDSARASAARHRLAHLAAGLLALGASLLFAVPTARAQTPSPAVLQELRERLTRQAPCQLQGCLAVPRLSLSLAEQVLTITAQVHAGDTATYKLPGPASAWVPRQVEVDGEPSTDLALLADGYLHLRLGPGLHTVKLSGPVQGNQLTLTGGSTPHHVSVEAAGWEVDGVRDDGHIEGSIQLSRRASGPPTDQPGPDQPGPEQPPPKAAAAEVILPPWLEIERVLEIGVSWTIQTTVRRVSPLGSPVVVRYPLLAGEKVTKADLLVENGEAILTLGRQDRQLEFSSAIKPAATIRLTAPQGRPFTEHWLLRCGPIWHCTTAGLAPIRHQLNDDWAPSFRPWPGEQLKLTFERPPPAEGQSTTVDEAYLTLTPGTRLQKASLKLVVRTSTGGQHSLTVPPTAELRTLAVDGKDIPIRREGDKVTISTQPGKQTIVLTWQQPGELGLRYQAPRVGLEGRAVNARVDIVLPQDRWVLWAGGPSWGPAVLYWGYVLLILAVAIILSRLPKSPLKAWQWALLGLGLTQIPVLPALFIVGWFFLMSYRKDWKIKRPLAHDAVQVGLALYTLGFLVAIVATVYRGLVIHPDMAIAGSAAQGETLAWLVDRVTDTLPQPWVISTSVWAWRVVMLGWALWLAFYLVRWLRDAWQSFNQDGAWKLSLRPQPSPAGGGAATVGSSSDQAAPPPDQVLR